MKPRIMLKFIIFDNTIILKIKKVKLFPSFYTSFLFVVFEGYKFFFILYNIYHYFPIHCILNLFNVAYFVLGIKWLSYLLKTLFDIFTPKNVAIRMYNLTLLRTWHTALFTFIIKKHRGQQSNIKISKGLLIMEHVVMDQRLS